MGLNERQQSLLNQLVSRGILDTPNMKLRKLPPVTAPIQNRSSDYASYLLTNAVGNKGVAKAMSKSIASTQNADDEEQSMLSKLFDTLMIPNHMMSDVGSAIADGMQGKDDSFVENLGQELKGVGGAVLGAGQELTDKLFTRGLQNIPYIGDKISEVTDQAAKKMPLSGDTFQNVLHDKFDVNNPVLRHGGGLALDILTDPTTFLGTGLMKVGSLRKAKDVLDAKAALPAESKAFIKPAPVRLPEAPSVAERAIKGNPVLDQNILGQLPKIPHVQVGTPLMDTAREAEKFAPKTRGLARRVDPETGMTPAQMRVALGQKLPNPARTIEQKLVRRQVDFERAMTAVGKVADSPSKINMRSVNNVIQKIQNGELPRVMPKIESATGDAAVAARDIADDVIDGMMGQKKVAGKRITWRGPGGKIVSRKLPPELTAGQQLALFSKLVGKAGPKSLVDASKMLRSAEDHLISLGVQMTRHEGVRVRLSDVMALAGDKVPLETILTDFSKTSFKNMDPNVRAAIQTAATYRSMAMADILENVTKYAEKARREIPESYVGRQAAAAENSIMEGGIEHGIRMGATHKELDAVRNLLRNVINIDKLPAENFLNAASEELSKAVVEGRVNPKILDQFNKLVAKSLGITSDNLTTKISGSNVVDHMMLGFSTNWGKGQFFNPAKGLFDAGRLNAEARAETLRKLSQNFTKDEIQSAWKAAAGAKDMETIEPRVAQMASFFRGYMDAVLKVPSWGIKLENEGVKHLSVAERYQTLMKDVNRHLKEMQGPHAFQFTNKAIQRDAWGAKRNFAASGEGWLASWATKSPDDPLKMLFDIDLAMERATREYAFLDNFVFNFGSLTKTSTHTFKMPLDRISEFHVPEDVGRQMLRVMADIHKGNWAPNSPLTRFHGKALRIWKTGVTIYLPSHHIRNGIGDTYLMWLAGHNDPRAFIWAKRLMHSQKGRYKQAIDSGDFETLGKLTDPNAAKWAATNGRDVILNQNGIRVTADELYVGAWQRGLLKNANQLEDIFGESRIGFKPLGGKVHDAATTAAEYREHYIRLAHFTSAVNKSLKKGTKDLEKIFDDAASEVRKWHPDGSDLTYFEQKYLRNIVPFYSWIRKSTPLLVESLVTRPAKSLAYPRGIVALQNMMGIDATVVDPFPNDQLFPEWIRGYGIGPIGDAESDNPYAAWWGNLGKNMIDINGKPYGYTVVNPSNPLIDTGQQFMGFDASDTGRGIIDSLSPFIKVPLELGTDSQFTGAPIYKDSGGQGVLQYLSKQLPMTSPFQRVLDWRDRERVGKEPGTDKEALINMLTAAGIHGTAPYIKGAEFEKKAKLRNQ